MKPRITFRVNGSRIGGDARPTELPGTEPLAPIAAPVARLPMKRAIVPRAALSTRPNDYMPDDDGSEVAS
jgi:hypothetical protein